MHIREYANLVSFYGQSQDARSSCLQSVWTVQTSAIIAASRARPKSVVGSGFKQIRVSADM